MPLPEQAIQDIYKIREILENYSDKERQNITGVGGLKGFPAGYCGFCSELIGLLLRTKYNVLARYVTGNGIKGYSSLRHSWVECEGCIIDITADQFKDVYPFLPKVLITKESQFHQELNKIEPNYIMSEESFIRRENISYALGEIYKTISSEKEL